MPTRRPLIVPSPPSTRQVGRDLLAGLVTSLALIPEVVSFSIVCGVSPEVGLLSSFTISLVVALLGGRPAMVSAAAGSMALVAAPLVHAHGADALAAATVLAGLLQLVLVGLGVHRLIAQLPRSVAIGFVNGLAVLIFIAQMDQVSSVLTASIVTGGVVLLTGLRRLRLPVPPSLISTAVILGVVLIAGWHVTTVGDKGALPSGLPRFHAPALSGLAHTLGVIAPTAVSLALVGLIESLLTADIIDRLTGTTSSRRREGLGQGAANIVVGFVGGQPGCAMIGQAILCVESGGRGRIATLSAGAWLLFLVVVLHPVMAVMPVAALVVTMVLVAVTTFDWASLARLAPGRWPLSESGVVAVTTAVIVLTSNLAYGVIAGTVAALGVLLVRRHPLDRLGHAVEMGRDGIHRISGPLSFLSIGRLIGHLEAHPPHLPLHLDLSGAEILDSSASLALDELVTRHRSVGRSVELVGLSPSSEARHRRMTAPGGAGD